MNKFSECYREAFYYQLSSRGDSRGNLMWKDRGEEIATLRSQ